MDILTEEQFDENVKKDEHIYAVEFRNKILKVLMKGVPELESLEEIVKALKKYLPAIGHSGINVVVEIDEKNFKISIDII